MQTYVDEKEYEFGKQFNKTRRRSVDASSHEEESRVTYTVFLIPVESTSSVSIFESKGTPKAPDPLRMTLETDRYYNDLICLRVPHPNHHFFGKLQKLSAKFLAI